MESSCSSIELCKRVKHSFSILSCLHHLGSQWAMYASIQTPQSHHYDTLDLTQPPIDPFPNRTDPHHRLSKDGTLLRAKAKTQRHGSFYWRHHPHSMSLALDRLPHRALWHLRPLRRLLLDDRKFCRQHTSRRAISATVPIHNQWWQTQR